MTELSYAVKEETTEEDSKQPLFVPMSLLLHTNLNMHSLLTNSQVLCSNNNSINVGE